MSLYDYGSDDVGLHFTITTSVNAQTGFTDFTVNVITGSLNLNAVYWSNGDDVNDDMIGTDLIGFTGVKSENSLNMNGSNVVWNDDGTFTTAKEVYDGGIKLSDAGLGKVLPLTYLTEGGEFTFSADVDLSLFSTLGVRATSTSTAEGSIKWVDDTPVEPDDSLAFDGLPRDAWRTVDEDGSPIGSDNWLQTTYQTTDSYEEVFGIDSIVAVPAIATGNVDGMSLLDVLISATKAVKGGVSEGTLGRETVTALLNADSSGETELTTDYRFTTSEIISAVQEVYDDGFDTVQGADLHDLLEFWNNAPGNNVGEGATVPGELHSDDTTEIATTLLYEGSNGGSFEGNIFEVLNGLHPDHGWLSGAGTVTDIIA